MQLESKSMQLSSPIVLVAMYIGHDLKIDRSTYEILQISGISLLDKTTVKELLTNTYYKNFKEHEYR